MIPQLILVDKDFFIGYKISYQDLNSGNQNAESVIVFINGITYVATYSKVVLSSQQKCLVLCAVLI